jgi:hypothetical protein
MRGRVRVKQHVFFLDRRQEEKEITNHMAAEPSY